MRLHAILASAALSLAACATPEASTPTALAQRPAGAEDHMLEAQRAAQAGANRPGDDQLSCMQLEIEMTALATDPAMTSAMASNAENAKRITDLANQTTATMNGLSALSLASSLQVPGADMLATTTGYAQRATMDAQMNQQQEIMDKMMGNIAQMQPAIYRRLRVSELAAAKSCAWLRDY